MQNRAKIALSVLFGVLIGGGGVGCRKGTIPPSVVSPPQIPVVTNAPLPENPTPAERIRLIQESLEKRVLGRVEAMEDIERVSTTLRPTVEQSVLQAEVQPILEQMAQKQGIPLDVMRRELVDLQEADLLLEAGGRPDATSSAQAVGVAQWLASTAQGVGLRVDRAESRRLTAQIIAKQQEKAWLLYQSQPISMPNLPGSLPLTTDQAKAKLPLVEAEIELMRQFRRAIDERYDPQKAIFAQTRYLLSLYAKFPSPDWIFQAYHGGEGGVRKLLRLYGDGQAGETPPSFESLYLSLNPKEHLPALLYLYGRSDHHRYYWWKIRAAQKVLRAFREDRGELTRYWQTFLPGRSREVQWHPKAHTEPVVTTLRPETASLLRKIDRLYHEIGGKEALAPLELSLSPNERKSRLQEWRKQHPVPSSNQPLPPFPSPYKPPTEGLPAFDFDYHNTGIVFDLAQPRNRTERTLLEYALSNYADLGVLAYSLEKEASPPRYHILPNPRHTQALIASP